MKFLMLNGSPNCEGNTYYLLNEIKKEIEKDKFECEIINIQKIMSSAKWPFCICCSQPCDKRCYKGTLLDDAFDKLKECDCLIVGSPVYFGTMSGQLKTFFDKTRALRGEKCLVGKPAGVVTVGASKYGGEETTAGSIIDTLQVEGMTIFNNGFSNVDAGHKGVLAQRPASEDENAKKLIENFAKRAVLEAKKYVYSKGIV